MSQNLPMISADFSISSWCVISGKFVPALAHEILENKEDAKMNFQGMMIGSGLCDPPSMMNYGEYLLSLGLISELQGKQFKRQERIILEHLKEEEYLKAFLIFNELIDGDRVNKTRTYFKRKTGFNFKFNVLKAKVAIRPPLPFDAEPSFQTLVPRP